MPDDQIRAQRREASAQKLVLMGHRIRRLRRDRELTQEQLAAAANIDRRVVGYIEHGQRDFGVALLWPIASALGVNAADLLGGLD